MSKRLKSNISLIHFLIDNITESQSKLLLRTLTKDQVDTISELAANVLYGNIPITDKFKGLLRRYKSKIEYIGNAKNSLAKRKNVVAKQY